MSGRYVCVRASSDGIVRGWCGTVHRTRRAAARDAAGLERRRPFGAEWKLQPAEEFRALWSTHIPAGPNGECLNPEHEHR